MRRFPSYALVSVVPFLAVQRASNGPYNADTTTVSTGTATFDRRDSTGTMGRVGRDVDVPAPAGEGRLKHILDAGRKFVSV
jgi:hypothetical protein